VKTCQKILASYMYIHQNVGMFVFIYLCMYMCVPVYVFINHNTTTLHAVISSLYIIMSPLHTKIITSPLHTITSPLHAITSPLHTITSPSHTIMIISPLHTIISSSLTFESWVFSSLCRLLFFHSSTFSYQGDLRVKNESKEQPIVRYTFDTFFFSSSPWTPLGNWKKKRKKNVDE